MRVWSIVSTIFTLVLVLLVVVFFAFEKSIPTGWAEEQIKYSPDALAYEDYEDLKAKERYGFNKEMWQYSYDENGEQVLQSHIITESAMVVVDGNVTMHYVNKIVDVADESKVDITLETYYYMDNDLFKARENGVEEEKTGTAWKTELAGWIYLASPMDYRYAYKNENILKNNLEKITQKGVYVFGYASKDNVRIRVAYDFLNSQIKEIREEEDTFSGEEKISTVVTVYKVLYPTEIVVPSGAE